MIGIPKEADVTQGRVAGHEPYKLLLNRGAVFIFEQEHQREVLANRSTEEKITSTDNDIGVS